MLPVRAGRQVGDADESSKKIDWFEVLAYIAALDCPLHECANRFPNLAVGSFKHLFRIAHQPIEHRRDNLLRGDVVNAADAVIHARFIHDLANYAAAAEIDRSAVDTIGAVLTGSDRPFIVTSGTALTAPGRVATEKDSANSIFPRKPEEAAASAAAGGAQVSVLRLHPSVHGVGDQGFIPILIRLAREKNVSAYVAQGLNRWSAVHRLDAARLYRLVLEKSPMEPRYHAVADKGVPFHEIAQVIGRRLNIPFVSKSPEEASDHFGWFAHFAALACPASSAQTQEQLGWLPTKASHIPDIDQPSYFEADQPTFHQKGATK